MKVLISGGTGLIGTRLSEILEEKGNDVQILTRNAIRPNHVQWNPEMHELDKDKIYETEVLINLCGAGIADKKWTKRRKQELLNSRVVPILFLKEQVASMPNLRQFISISGINCYGFEQGPHPFKENDPYGTSYIDLLVKAWEAAAESFKPQIAVVVLRAGVVLSDRGGAVEKIVRPMRSNLGAAIGSGEQNVPWIHIDDLVNLIEFSLRNKWEGVFNAFTGNSSNKELTLALAQRLGKKIRLPNVPSVIMKMLYGEMAELLLKGVTVSNQKIRDQGFQFTYPTLNRAVSALKID